MHDDDVTLRNLITKKLRIVAMCLLLAMVATLNS